MNKSVYLYGQFTSDEIFEVYIESLGWEKNDPRALRAIEDLYNIQYEYELPVTINEETGEVTVEDHA